MSFPDSPHLVIGDGTQVGIITLWTKKEHVTNKIPKELYAVAAQLYSRDEGLSMLVRSLLQHPNIRDLVVVGADLNNCAETLLALWNNGVRGGQVKDAPGYIDTEIPENAIDGLRKNVRVHDLRSEKDYTKVAEYIKALPTKEAWGKPKTFPMPTITPPETFPTAHQHTLRHKTIDKALIELAHQAVRFGELYNVHIHLLEAGEDDLEYSKNFFSTEEGTYGATLAKHNVIETLTTQLESTSLASVSLPNDFPVQLITAFTQDGTHLAVHVSETNFAELAPLSSALFLLLKKIGGKGSVSIGISKLTPHPTHIVKELHAKAHVLRRQGDPRSNILIRVKEGRIQITHLSPEGKRLEEFSVENAREGYKRLVVEHRITDLSHAAYLGYELARAETALKTGGMYEQDSNI